MITKHTATICAILTVLVIRGIVFCQFPGFHIVPYDSLVFQDSLLTTFKIINFNEDDYYDYYIATSDRSYLIDGLTKDTLWLSNYSDNRKYENLEYIESDDVWRCFIVEYLPDNENDFRLKTVDIPEVTPEDSIDFIMGSVYSGGPFIAGYLPFPIESYYVHIDYRAIGEYIYRLGKIFIFDSAMNSLTTSFMNGRFPTSHHFINISDIDYFIVVANYYHYWQHMGGWETWYGLSHMYNESYEVISDFSSNDTPYYYSSDLLYDSLNTTYMLLLAGGHKIVMYQDVLNDSVYSIINFPISSNYAQFISIEGGVKIIGTGNIGSMEILNMDLSFYRYIFEDAPLNLKNIQTEDIDFDGTDELFCIYDSIIRIYKLDDGVGIDDPSTSLPTFHASNHPNPFNASTTIEYSLSEPANVQITIYNLLGQQIANLVDSPLPAGNHQVTWNAGDLPSGMYFYRTQAGDYSQSKKMLLLK